MNIAADSGTALTRFEGVFFAPPAWSPERKTTIVEERESFLQKLRAPVRGPAKFGLLVAEFDKKDKGQNKVSFKSLASPGFYLDDEASLRFDRKMADCIEMVRDLDGARLIAIATFRVREHYCTIQSIDMMPVNRERIPFSDRREFDLTSALSDREFVKTWDHKINGKHPAATAFLLDSSPRTALFFLASDEDEQKARRAANDDGCAAWIWPAGCVRRPPLPPRIR